MPYYEEKYYELHSISYRVIAKFMQLSGNKSIAGLITKHNFVLEHSDHNMAATNEAAASSSSSYFTSYGSNNACMTSHHHHQTNSANSTPPSYSGYAAYNHHSPYSQHQQVIFSLFINMTKTNS